MPFLRKDILIQEAGGLTEFGSRLAAGLRMPNSSELALRYERAGLVSFEFRTASEPMVARLKQKRIIVSEKDGHVRAGVLFYNNEDDIDRFLDAMTEL